MEQLGVLDVLESGFFFLLFDNESRKSVFSHNENGVVLLSSKHMWLIIMFYSSTLGYYFLMTSMPLYLVGWLVGEVGGGVFELLCLLFCFKVLWFFLGP